MVEQPPEQEKQDFSEIFGPATGSLSHPFVIVVDMAHAQLHLLDFGDELWKLDDRTIKVGRKGLATARAALARSARPVAQADKLAA